MNHRGDGPLPASEGEQVWNVLSQIPSTPQGTGPILYVLAYNTCPHTIDFFRDHGGKLNHKVQMRWILFDVRGQPATSDAAADAAVTKDPGTVMAILGHKRSSPSYFLSLKSLKALQSVRIGMIELNRIFAENRQEGVSSPTFAFKINATVYINRGYEKGVFDQFELAPLLRPK